MEILAYILCGAAIVLFVCFLKHRYLSFSAQRPSDYAAGSQIFDLREHLVGAMVCEGVIYGPTGRVVSRFVGNFDARWTGGNGVMSEDFLYDSGEWQHREWRLTLDPAGRITATADDVVGTGTGLQSGATVQLLYRIKLPDTAGGHVLTATDWMYLAPNGTIVNRSQFRKYGIKVAELVATMRRKEVM